jgi:ArsR family transcriptional regulator
VAPKKEERFKRADEELSRLAKALATPAKVAILRVLAERKSCICGEIVQITPLSQSTVSQHLKELKELGLIQGRIEGAKSCYCIDHEGFATFAETLTKFLGEIKKHGKKTGSC